MSIDWRKSTAFPEPRSGYAAGVIDGRLVIAGGTYWEGSAEHWTRKVYSASTHSFDPASQRWNKLPDAPLALGYTASTVVSDRLFVVGGYTGRGVNHEIFALENTQDRYLWKRYRHFDLDRVFAAALGVGKSISLLGGTTRFEPFDSAGTCCTTKTATNSFMTLDTDHPEMGWRQLSPYPGNPRWLPATATDGKSIWMFGGLYQAEAKDPVTKFNDVLRYDISKQKWEAMTPLPKAIVDGQPLTALRVGNRILLFTFEKKVWQFDLGTPAYSELTPLPEKVVIDKFVLLNDQIIGASGESEPEGPRRRSEWTFIGRLGNQDRRSQ